jgi:hypothetical protein
MESYITDDGSVTFRNSDVDEFYHTKAGAIVEALEKHARALKVWEKKNPIIFDVCSGLSYSAACALEEIRDHGNDSLVTIYLFENDKTILKKNLELPDVLEYVQDGIKHRITCYKYFKIAIKDFLENDKTIYEPGKPKNFRIITVFGDINKTINSVANKADFIFYAPFSPKFTPEMWNYDIFKKLYSQTAKNGKLSTYSYARIVRDALTRAGFAVKDGPTLGRRSPSIVAIKKSS